MDKSIGKNELERGAFIGDENFGVVYQGKWNGHEVAIKKLHIRHLPEYLATEYNNHFKALGHPNIIITHGICEEPRKHAIVMELMQTSLKRWIEESNKMGTPISSKVKNNIGFQAGKGLSFLHSKQIPHRHLKSSNVLLRFLPGGGIEVKLTDMGLSQLRVEASQMGRKKATVRWRAPETFIREYARTKDQIEVLKPADVYALGMLLWEMNAI